jgi:hypothetical protein
MHRSSAAHILLVEDDGSRFGNEVRAVTSGQEAVVQQIEVHRLALDVPPPL